MADEKGKNLKGILDGLFKTIGDSASKGFKGVKLPTVETEVKPSNSLILFGAFALVGVALISSQNSRRRRR